jgi:rhamnosyltransferase
MFVARTEAIRLLSEHPWTYADFDRTDGLDAALERMWSYAAGQLGFHTRTVATREYLSLSHSLLEYELGEMSATIPGRSFEKIDFLRHSGWAGSGTAGDLLRMYVRRRHAWFVHVARRVADPARLPGRLLPGRSRARDHSG